MSQGPYFDEEIYDGVSSPAQEDSHYLLISYSVSATNFNELPKRHSGWDYEFTSR